MNTEQLITEACSLPLEQRAQVVQSLSASNAVIDQAWLSLAQRRHDELISGKLDPVTPARLTSMKPLAKSVRFDDSMMWVSLADGRQLGVPLTFFPRLLQAQSSPASGRSTCARPAHWCGASGVPMEVFAG